MYCVNDHQPRSFIDINLYTQLATFMARALNMHSYQHMISRNLYRKQPANKTNKKFFFFRLISFPLFANVKIKKRMYTIKKKHELS